MNLLYVPELNRKLAIHMLTYIHPATAEPFITSAKEVMLSPGFVCGFVTL